MWPTGCAACPTSRIASRARVAAGIMVNFTPLFGFHFLSAAAVAWIIRGNVLAALLATFVGNPVTLPFIALMSVKLGREILGQEGELTPSSSSTNSRRPPRAVAQPQRPVRPVRDALVQLSDFLAQVFWPYYGRRRHPGSIAGVITHYLTVPIFIAYQRRRERRRWQSASPAPRPARHSEGGSGQGRSGSVTAVAVHQMQQRAVPPSRAAGSGRRRGRRSRAGLGGDMGRDGDRGMGPERCDPGAAVRCGTRPAPRAPAAPGPAPATAPRHRSACRVPV